MNNVSLVGRMTRDPEVRYKEELAIARFTLAVARPKQPGKEATSDFPSIIAFGKTAEMVEKYLGKGRLIGVTGRIQTGSYTDKDGKKVYTTEVVADRVEFLDKKEDKPVDKPVESGQIEGFERIDDEELPF